MPDQINISCYRLSGVILTSFMPLKKTAITLKKTLHRILSMLKLQKYLPERQQLFKSVTIPATDQIYSQ